MKHVQVFALLQGHPRNVGDATLRRVYADALRAAGGPLGVFAGPPHHGYIQGLRLQPQDVQFPTLFSLYLAVLHSAMRGRGVLALNAGQYTLSPRYLLHALLLLPLCRLLRFRGGHVIWLGAAVPEAKLGRTWVYRLLARQASMTRWRDVVSPEFIGSGGVMPDWAFGTGETRRPPEISEKSTLVVSLRGDRPPPSASWIAEIKAACQRLDLQPYVVVQVDEDQRIGEWLAQRLDAKMLGWGDGDLSGQEDSVLALYHKAAVVVSDRLHVLIMAMAQGAVPLGWCETSTSKLDRHFAVVGLDWVTVEPQRVVEKLATLSATDLERMRTETWTSQRKASQDVQSTVEELTGLIGSDIL